MGLRIKRAARQLDPDEGETIWPGDSAVDLEASDLVTWCREGGKAGLVLKSDEAPDIIRWRPLDEFAFGRVSELLGKGSRNLPLVAFRHGVLAVGSRGLARVRIDDADGLHDEAVRELSECRMELPYLVALRQLREAMSGNAGDEEASEDMMLTSLPQAIGVHILAATFRQRRDAA